MTPTDFYQWVLLPGADACTVDASPQSKVMLMAIAGQESGWSNRLQIGGPARGYWQFDQTAVLNIMGNPATRVYAESSCSFWDVGADGTTVFEALAWHDPLAYEFARLLLWANPAPLPSAGDVNGSWLYYLATWRPGDPKPDSWTSVYATAMALVSGTSA